MARSEHPLVVMVSLFEYQTVDIPTHKGEPQIDVTCHLMGQEGWSPVVLISPSYSYDNYSILFARAKSRIHHAPGGTPYE